MFPSKAALAFGANDDIDELIKSLRQKFFPLKIRDGFLKFVKKKFFHSSQQPPR